MSKAQELIFKIAIPSIIIGGGLAWRAWKRKKHARMVQDTARSKLATAAQGHAEFEGFAWAKDHSHTDFHGNERVYYTFSLEREETRGSGKNKRREWIPKFQWSLKEPFYLLDPSGLATIDPQGADLYTSGDKIRMWKDIPQAEKDFYCQSIIVEPVESFPPTGSTFGLFDSKFRIVEREIRVGCPLLATGDFRTHSREAEGVMSPGLTDFAGKVLDMDARSIKKIDRILDRNSDGTVCDFEARHGYSTAAKIAKVKALKDSPIETHFDLLGTISSSADHELFVIDAHEHHAVARLTRFVNAQLVGGVAMVLIGMYLPFADFESFGNSSKGTRMVQLSQSSPARQLAATKAIGRSHLLILHEQCYAGNALSCEKLVMGKDRFKLTPDYVGLYQKQLCKLDATKCPR